MAEKVRYSDAELEEFRTLLQQKNYNGVFEKIKKINAIKEILAGIN